jgi:hypothetical protein
MTEDEKNELLVRLDTRQAAIEKRLEKIEAKLSMRMCYTHAEKLKALERIVWGATCVAIGSAVKSFWF